VDEKDVGQDRPEHEARERGVQEDVRPEVGRDKECQATPDQLRVRHDAETPLFSSITCMGLNVAPPYRREAAQKKAKRHERDLARWHSYRYHP